MNDYQLLLLLFLGLTCYHITNQADVNYAQYTVEHKNTKYREKC